MALCAVLKAMNDRYIAALSQANCKEEDLMTCRQMLRTLHHFWSRAADIKPALSLVTGADPNRAAPIGPDLPGEQRHRRAPGAVAYRQPGTGRTSATASAAR